MEHSCITRPCLGGPPRLGGIYDAKQDAICTDNIFMEDVEEIEKEFSRSIESPFTRYHVVKDENISDRFSSLDIHGEIKASILAKMVSLEGAALYLTDQATLSKSEPRKSMIFSVKTVVESINFLDDDVQGRISENALDTAVETGTHVIQEIWYGGTMVVSYKCPENKQGDQAEPKYFGDVVLRNDQLPSNMNEVTELISQAPSLMATLNNGKGRAISMRLIPIQYVQMYLNKPVTPEPIFRPLGELHVNKIMRAFEQLSTSQREFHDLHQLVLDFKYCIRPDVLQNILDHYREVQNNPFPSRLANVLRDVRGGLSDVTKLDELVIEIREACLKSSSILSNRDQVQNKISLARLLEKNGIQYIGNDESIEAELLKSNHLKSCVLYFSTKWKQTEPERWSANMRLILDKSDQEDRDKVKFFAVDCDLHPCPTVLDTCVKVFPCAASKSSTITLSNGKGVIVEDLLAEEEKEKICSKKNEIGENAEHLGPKSTQAVPGKRWWRFGF